MKYLSSKLIKTLQFLKNVTSFNSDVAKRYYNETNHSLVSSKLLNFENLKTISINRENIESPEAAKILRDNGIIVIMNFLSDDIIDAAKSEIDNFLNLKDETLTIKGKVPYSTLANHAVPVINPREGDDEGMLDIFNYQLRESKYSKILYHEMGSLNVASLLHNAYNAHFIPKNLNIYSNKSITHTRGFHVDSYQTTFKAFLYLTDVTNLNQGPYTYVLGSNSCPNTIKMNQLIASKLKNSSDTPFFYHSNATPILGPKGTLVISDQAGIHRGWPQAIGAERLAAIMRFYKK